MSDLEDQIALVIGQAVILDADFVRSRPMQLHDAAKAVLALGEKVWWCAEWGLLDAGRVDVCRRVHGDAADCGWRWLVSAKEEE